MRRPSLIPSGHGAHPLPAVLIPAARSQDPIRRPRGAFPPPAARPARLPGLIPARRAVRRAPGPGLTRVLPGVRLLPPVRPARRPGPLLLPPPQGLLPILRAARTHPVLSIGGKE